MLKLHIAISLATVLGLGIPASAQAQTAVDDFEVTLNITPQTSDTMQIVGLEDVLFSEQVYSHSNPTAFPQTESYLCLLRTGPGNVRLSISQPDPLNPTGTYGGWYLKDAAFPDVYLPVSIIFASPTDPSLSALNPNDSYISPPSSSACSAASGPTEAHTIHVGASLVGVDPAQTPAPPGHYSQQFTLLLEPE
jgi:hypothetical protein